MKDILLKLFSILFGLLTPEMLKDLMDHVLDFIEDKVASTDADWDDKIFLPICNLIRVSFNIPDND